MASCTVTITPGQVAASDCTTGIAPTPGTITINASSAPSSVVSNVSVLSYGCIYQGGFIYSVDDTTASTGSTGSTGSIGGKTAAVYDTVPGQTDEQAGEPNWGGYGIDISPDGSTYENSPEGANDGSANTATITNALGSGSPSYAANSCTDLSVNAAGSPSCTSPNTCYTNWYLPSICELGPFGGICTTGSTNMQEQLYNATPPITANFVDGADYWSSTEFSLDPQGSAGYENFSIGGSVDGFIPKIVFIGVRCSRAF